MKITNNLLFPVPVTYVENVLDKQQVADILTYTLQQQDKTAAHPSIIGQGTSYHHTHTDYVKEITNNVTSCKDLQSTLLKLVLEYSEYTGLMFTTFHNSWFNIQNEGSILKRHTHAGCTISGALYINVDENSSPLIFDNPNPIPYHLNQSKNSIFTDTEHTFNPQSGDVILFPSILAHHSGLQPNRTKNRTVISFNTV